MLKLTKTLQRGMKLCQILSYTWSAWDLSIMTTYLNTHICPEKATSKMLIVIHYHILTLAPNDCVSISITWTTT